MNIDPKGVLMLAFISIFSACNGNKQNKNQVQGENMGNDSPAYFDYFSYSSDDSRYDAQSTYSSDSFYTNPILAGCYPDPSICRKGNDYYLVNSTFVYYPGIPIWHSTDLTNWEQIGYVLDRPSQLSFPKGIVISNGIYAPAISYNPYNDTFYLIVTGVGNGGNFVVKTKDPNEGWSDPIFVPEVGGIDPSFLFDSDGKAYIVNNDDPDYPAEYDGHRAIRIREYDVTTDKVIGISKVIIDKGVHPEDKPIWIEGPHLYHIGDTYYLMAAEGGTEEGHSEVVFSSKKPMGPFIPCAINPILTQRTLSADRANPITCTGHADLIQTPEGNWWAVFLGVLPYESDKYCNTGRSTFLLPVRWKNGQPVILDNETVVPTFLEKPYVCKKETDTYGNISYIDNFDSLKDIRWMSLRGPSEEWSHIKDGQLQLNKQNISLDERDTPSMLCQWVKHSTFTAETSVRLLSIADSNEVAGITYYMNDNSYMACGISVNGEGKSIIRLINKYLDDSKQPIKEIKDVSLPRSFKKTSEVFLRVQQKGSEVEFYYSLNKRNWKKAGDTLDAKSLSILRAGGFTGAVIGLFITSDNQ